MPEFLCEQFAPEEYLYRSGEFAHEMFFIASGSVDEVSEKDKVRNTCNGNF